MSLKLYVDRMSQPSRAVLLFCKMNKIDFEEIGDFVIVVSSLFTAFYPILDIDVNSKSCLIGSKRDATYHRGAGFSILTIQSCELVMTLRFAAILRRVGFTDIVCLRDVTLHYTFYIWGKALFIPFLMNPHFLCLLKFLRNMYWFINDIAEINPFKQVPAMVDGRFKLSESHAILIYLSRVFPGVADHWYPADVSKQAKIHSVLDWHHSNLRRGAMTYVFNTTLAPALGKPLNPQAAAEGEKLLDSALSKIETIWLKGNGKFLLGSLQPSIADLSLVCEIMQLEVVDEDDRARILGPYKKVLVWIEATKVATRPHFDDVHGILFKAKARFQKQRERDGATLRSKI